MKSIHHLLRFVLLAVMLATLIPTLTKLPEGGPGMFPHVAFNVIPADGQPAGIKTFVIIVSEKGFNGTHSSNLVIAVNEGDRVEIVFVMDEEFRKDTRPINKHIMEITGYDITSKELSPSNPRVSVVFLADKVGSFVIMCGSETWDCPGHENLQDGQFVVGGPRQPPPPPPVQPPPVEEPAQPAPPVEPQPPPQQPAEPPPQQPAQPPAQQPAQPAPAPSPRPEPQVVKTQLYFIVQGQGLLQSPFMLTAILTDSEGNGILGMPIHFAANTTFGMLRIGSPYTDEEGKASVNYTTTREGLWYFRATFPGGGGYEGSTANATRNLTNIYMTALSPLTPSNVAIVVVVIVALSIWGVFAYAGVQIRAISRGGRVTQREEVSNTGYQSRFPEHVRDH